MSSRRTALLIIAVGLAVFAVAYTAASAAGAETQPVRALVAQVAPPGTTVSCMTMTNGDEGRTYQVGPRSFDPHIDLSRSTCSELAALKAHAIVNATASANALETLLHEAHHLTMRSGDEGAVECHALASMRYWLNRLGYHGARATQLLRLAWSEHDKLPAQYLKCVDPYQQLIGITLVQPVAKA